MTDFRNMTVEEYVEDRKMAGCTEIGVKEMIQDMTVNGSERVNVLNEAKKLVESGKASFYQTANGRCIK